MLLKAINIPSKVKFKEIVAAIDYKKISQTSYEAIFELDKKCYLFVYSFGAIVLVNVDKDEELKVRSKFSQILPVNNHNMIPHFAHSENVEDTYELIVNPRSSIRVEHSRATIDSFNLEYIKMFALVLAESVALQAFEDATEKILLISTEYSRALKRYGAYPRSKKELLKFIGFVTTTRQDILSNLYISDSPDEAWDNAKLEKIFKKMMNLFDIEPRFRSLNLSLGSIQESVEIMVDLLNTKTAHFMELCIIGLIAFEIIWSFIEKFIGS